MGQKTYRNCHKNKTKNKSTVRGRKGIKQNKTHETKEEIKTN